MNFCIVFILAAVNAKPRISLGSEPMQPFYHPQPAGSHFGVIVPPDKKNFSQSGDRVQEMKDSTSGPGGFTWPEEEEEEEVTESTNSEHKPGNIVGQVIPPSKNELNLVVTSITFVNRIKDTTTVASKPEKQTPINLGYKPTRPFYHPNPGNTLGQIIPPGKPWPDSPEGYQNFSQTLQPGLANTPSSMGVLGFIAELTQEKPTQDNASSLVNKIKESTSKPETTVASLEYKPNGPFYHPNPGNTSGQIVPPVQNFSQVINSPTLENRVKITTSKPSEATTTKVQTPISLEYKPVRPFYHSNPGNTLSQIIPPGKPWPDSLEGYQNFSQVSDPPSLENRIKNVTSKPIQSAPTSTPISLEYKPSRPFYHPNSGNTLGQIIPPGKPWPDSSEGYQNFSQVSDPPSLENRIKNVTSKPIQSAPTSTPISLEYKPNRPFYHPNPGNTLGQIIPPGKPWPDSSEGYQNFSQVGGSPELENRAKEATPKPIQSAPTSTPISLEYKPSRPFYHPNPGNTLGQIIPPGKPWPDSSEGYQNFSQVGGSPGLENRVKEATPKPSLSAPTSTSISLEYKPNMPFDHPNRGNTLGQIIFPDNPNFSQVVEDRVKETSLQPGSTTSQTTPISLEYKPNRPPFHPNPGNNVGQIIPPGATWPDSLEGYQNFSQVVSSPKVETTSQPDTTESKFPFHQNPGNTVTQIIQTSSPNLGNRNQESPSTASTPDLISLLQELVNKRKPWPNGLQTATSPDFVWETETSSEKIDQNQETSTMEGTLFTSPFLEVKNEEKVSGSSGKSRRS